MFPITCSDQIGHAVRLDARPERIVSLVPSQTELLFSLGLKDRIAGITRFCIHPEEACRLVPKIGGTKKFDFEKIDAIRPDLVLGNKEENYVQGIEKLQKKYPVWVSDIVAPEDAFGMMRSVGEMTATSGRAGALIKAIQAVRRETVFTGHLRRAAYFIWQNPLMVAGGMTFINSMLKEAGFSNVFENIARYPEVTPGQAAAAEPEFVFLSSEPFPFNDDHRPVFEKMIPGVPVVLVDGAMFSWYGSRLVEAFRYFRTLRKNLPKG